MTSSTGPVEHADPRNAVPRLIVGSLAGTVFSLRAKDGAIAWQQTIDPPCITSLVATPDIICVASQEDARFNSDQSAVLTALRVRDGSLLWQNVLPHLASGINLALALDLVAASAASGDESVYVFQIKTGRLRWIYGLSAGMWKRLRWKYRYGATWLERLRTALTGGSATWLMGRLIAARGKTILVSEPDPPEPPHLSALEARRGTIRWHYHQSWNSISVTEDSLHVVVSQRSLDGKWSGTVLDAEQGAVMAVFPLAAGDQIIACANRGLAYVLNPYTQTVSALRLNDGNVLWRATDSRRQDPARGGVTSYQAVVTDGILCYAQLIHREWVREVVALNAETGVECWTWRSSVDPNHSVGAATLIGGRNAVYLSSSQGVFALHTHDGALLWHALPTTDLSLVLPVLLPAP